MCLDGRNGGGGVRPDILPTKQGGDSEVGEVFGGTMETLAKGST